MYNFLKRIFAKKNTSHESAPKLEWNEIIELMYDKGLAYDGKIISVTYSKDKAKRCVVLKDANGFFRYFFEQLYQFEQHEWEFIRKNKDALPAMWIDPESNIKPVSIFDTEENAVRELNFDPYYRAYFTE